MQLTLGIDLRISSAKVLALDDQGCVLASTSEEYPLRPLAPGCVEQDPSDWWDGVCHAIRHVLAQLRDRIPAIGDEAITGLVLSGQMNGAVLVDAAGAPVRPALTWLDRRSEPECRAANERAGDLLRDRALHDLNAVDTLGKLLWHRDHEPYLYERAARAQVSACSPTSPRRAGRPCAWARPSRSIRTRLPSKRGVSAATPRSTPP